MHFSFLPPLPFSFSLFPISPSPPSLPFLYFILPYPPSPPFLLSLLFTSGTGVSNLLISSSSSSLSTQSSQLRFATRSLCAIVASRIKNLFVSLVCSMDKISVLSKLHYVISRPKCQRSKCPSYPLNFLTPPTNFSLPSRGGRPLNYCAIFKGPGV